MRMFSEWLDSILENVDGISSSGFEVYDTIKSKNFEDHLEYGPVFLCYINVDDAVKNRIWDQDYLVKFKVNGLNDFLVLNKQLAQELRGGMSVQEQLDAFGMKYDETTIKRMESFYNGEHEWWLDGNYLHFEFSKDKKCRGVLTKDHSGEILVAIYTPLRGVKVKTITDLKTNKEVGLSLSTKFPILKKIF